MNNSCKKKKKSEMWEKLRRQKHNKGQTSPSCRFEVGVCVCVESDNLVLWHWRSPSLPPSHRLEGWGKQSSREEPAWITLSSGGNWSLKPERLQPADWAAVPLSLSVWAWQRRQDHTLTLFIYYTLLVLNAKISTLLLIRSWPYPNITFHNPSDVLH